MLEGRHLLVDWGVVQVWSKNKKELVARVDAYIDRYRPVFFVTERVGTTKRGVCRNWCRIGGALIASVS